jgi:hypothetical protein
MSHLANVVHDSKSWKTTGNLGKPDDFDDKETVSTNLRDTLLMHSSIEHRPCYSARILALKEKWLGFAILETEDLAVAPNVELALSIGEIVSMYIRRLGDDVKVA